MHLMLLADEVKRGVQEAGMVGFRFNTVGVSDAISMGTEGMCYSLQSRHVPVPNHAGPSCGSYNAALMLSPA